MVRAVEAGLPAEHLAVMMAAPRHWWAANDDAAFDDASCILPRRGFDAVFVAAIRQQRKVRMP